MVEIFPVSPPELKKVLDRLVSLGASEGDYSDNATTLEKFGAMLRAEGMDGTEPSCEKSESEEGVEGSRKNQRGHLRRRV